MSLPYAALPAHVSILHELDEARGASSAGERLAELRRAAPRLRDRLLQSGRAACVRTFDLADLPYPTRFGFSGAVPLPLPYVVMTNRANLVQFTTESGEKKTLLFNPTDVDRSAETPFFAELRAKMGGFLSKRLMAAFRRPAAHEQLAAAGIAPGSVDYIAFDHLHTQDVRSSLGTFAAAGGGAAIPAVYPRARLLVWRPEIDIFRALHPLQAPWYVRDGVRGVPADRILPVDGDLLLGRGVALVRTPGHTVGNWSLVLSTDSGIWTVSENGIAADAYTPEVSSIPGVRRAARREGVEVILNANTLEGRNEQYTSMVLEKTLADRCRDRPDIVQCFPSSELSPSPIAPGIAPAHRHGAITSGSPF